MSKLTIIVIFIWYSTSITWTLYLAVMAMKRQQNKLTIPTKVFAYPVIAIGLAVDMLYNITAGSILFFEFPQEWLFTTRCDRHLPNKGIRGNIARWFCKNFLDPFDPAGKHCE